MPRTEIYSVDLANGNLEPSLDVHHWGSMKPGQSAAETLHAVNSYGTPEGRHLDASRQGGTAFISNSVLVIPGLDNVIPGTAAAVLPGTAPGPLPLDVRLLLRLEFDSPHGSTPHAKGVEAGPEPWAVVLKLKRQGSATDAKADDIVAVTCQFNRGSSLAADGLRLNTPGALQRDQAATLIGSLDYDQWLPSSTRQAPLFVMEMAFCGVRPDLAQVGGIRHVAGCAFLNVAGKKDMRAFSSVGLSGDGASIGALGAALVTQNGIGSISVRFRRFSVFEW